MASNTTTYTTNPDGRMLVILGAGESGVGAAVLAQKEGFSIFLSDKGTISKTYKDELEQLKIDFEEGKHSEERILQADEVVKSPGIPDTIPLIKKITEKGIPIISEIEFASRYTEAQKICITGSNGKTTTTLLTHYILQNAGLNVGVAGNIGKSFARQVATTNHDIYVLELSSFQLDNMYKFKAEVAILMNITPDHLDRYPDFNGYADSKFRIIQNQTAADYFIYCADDECIQQKLNQYKIPSTTIPFSIESKQDNGGYINDKTLVLNNNTNQLKPLIMTLENLALQGKHNTYNSMAAGITSRIFDVRKNIIKDSLSSFKNIEHRLEFITNVHGVEFINDSKATNVNSTWYALENMNKPIIWIAGGVDKGNDYDILKELVKDKVKAIVCLGLDNSKIHEAFKGDIKDIIDTKSASEAIKVAYQLSKSGDVVLCSPACASFDLFENYEERGRKIKKAVRSL